MIKKTLYFGNPAYLSCKNNQLVIEQPTKSSNITYKETEPLKKTIPIEDIGLMVLDHQQITLTQVLLTCLLENNVALVTCSQSKMPFGLFFPLDVNTTQQERFSAQIGSSLPLKNNYGHRPYHKKSRIKPQFYIRQQKIRVKIC